jgi:hypothetical protein
MVEKSTKKTQITPLQYFQWWPMLLGPLAMVLVYIATMTGRESMVSRGSNEGIAMILLGICVIGFAAQAVKFRTEFPLFMLVLCVAFFCREWHFPGTSKGIYVALGLLAYWGISRKDRFTITEQHPLNIWLWSTFATYLLSQLIARRVFRYVYLPREDQLHIFLEETVETTGHIAMIVTCLIVFITTRKQSAPTAD